MINRLKTLPIALAVLSLGACSTMDNVKTQFSSGPLKASDYAKPIQGLTATDQAKKPDATSAQKLLASGVEYLQKGDLDKAHSVFSVALKLDINNPALHFLNALTYQMKYEAGDAASFDLAVTGYTTAISLDQALDNAYVQLGHLYFFAKDHARAQKAFAEAAAANSSSTQALMGLAQASMLSGDLKTSYWATVQLDDKKWKSPELLRLKAIQAALAKSPEKANEYARQYAQVVGKQGPDRDADYVASRVERLLTMKASYVAPITGGVLLAQAAPADKPKEGAAKEPEKGEPAKEEAASSGLVKPWFRCDPTPGLSLQKDGLPQIQLPAAEENATTLVLPRPCDGEKPPMAMIEVTMIRTEESIQRTQGINLLDGLKMVKDTFLNVANTRSVIGNSAGTTADPFSTSAATLMYSLNIANSLFAKNEVIARPTLSAVDRLPSVFFSGRTVSIASGTVNTGFTLSDKSVGTSLSITPTFMEEDSVLLSIRSSRSFIEPTENKTIALVQSRNAVNASARVKFGQTYVLNGLIEREKDEVDTGVPILMDIPIIQNLFSNIVKVDFNRQILTLVTVRRLVDDDDSVFLAKNPKGTVNGHKLSSQVSEFIDLQSNNTVLDEVLQGMRSDNSLYQRLRNRDAVQEPYSSRSVLQKILTDLKEIIYY